MNKFDEISPTDPKVIRPNTLNCARIFDSDIFPGAPKSLDLGLT